MIWPFSRRTRTATPPPRRRHLDAAAGDRRGAGMGHFGETNAEVGAGLEAVRRRARYLCANNSWCNNGLHQWAAHLVGSGIRPVVKSDDRETVSAAFEMWADDPDNFGGRTNFWGVQAELVQHLVRDGEALALLEAGQNGLEIQAIDPDRLDTARNAIELANGGVIVQGVEYDGNGRRAGYWIHPTSPNSDFATMAVSERVPAETVLHILRPMGAGQVRGLSWFAPVVLAAHELDQLSDALLVGAKVAAMHAGYLVDLNNSTAESPFEFDADGAISLEPGTVQTLPGGMDIKFTSPRDAKDSPAFLRFNLQQLAAGLGLPEHLLSGDLSTANYSSIRAGLLPFRQRVEQVQYHTLVPQFLAPIWRRWLALEVASGRLDARADTRVEWLMPRHLQVDPLKDVQAMREMLDTNLMSRTQAVAELGWSIDDLDTEIAADREREARLGLNEQQEGQSNATGQQPEPA